MTVYVDDYNAPFGRMIMCHMTSDNLEELHEMASKIGIARKWYQDKALPHYDISKSKKALAVQYGAKEITTRKMVEIMKPITTERRRVMREARAKAQNEI